MVGVVRLPNVPMSNGVSWVSPITIWILAHGDMQFFGDALAERCPYVLPDFHLAGIDRHYAIFSKVQPGSDFFWERFVRPPGCTRLLECVGFFKSAEQSKCRRREI